MGLRIEEKAISVLIVDDEENIRRVLSSMLRSAGYGVAAAKDGRDALDVMQRCEFSKEKINPIGVVISDLRMPGMDGLSLLSQMRKDFPDIPLIMITAHGSIDTAVDALKRGAFDYITKPFERDDLLLAVEKAAASFAGNRQNLHLPENDLMMIGESPQMQEVYQIIRKVAASPSSVLICGESGTGKELIAKAIHQQSSRASQPLITINCGAIPETLIESELFGHEKGAFTGAIVTKPGRFELAHGGTLFLDEVGEIPLTAQVKLLRVLQEKTFERVGSTRTIEVDLRLIAATNRDLSEMVSQGKFREDLYYRLNVVPIFLPPLRNRSNDIPLFVSHFLKHFNVKLGKSIKGVSETAMALLQQYRWPGNIRELENVMERMILLSDEKVLDETALPQEIQNTASSPGSMLLPSSSPSNLKDRVKQVSQNLEKQVIEEALSETAGNVTQAAKKLGISRKSLQIKMKLMGLRKETVEISA